MTGEARDLWDGDRIFWTRCVCGKRAYWSRSEARARKRQHQDRKGLNVYRCNQSRNRVFHIGHKPKALRRGDITRDEVVQQKRGTP